MDVDAAHLAGLQDDWALAQVQLFVGTVGWRMRLLIQFFPVLLVTRDAPSKLRIFCHPYCQRTERSSDGDAIYDYMIHRQVVFRLDRKPRKIAIVSVALAAGSFTQAYIMPQKVWSSRSDVSASTLS